MTFYLVQHIKIKVKNMPLELMHNSKNLDYKEARINNFLKL